MQYTITINQRELYKTKLDLIDSAILNYIYYICSSPSPSIERLRIDGYTWVNYDHLLKEMPLLRIKSIGALTPRFKKIEEAGYILLQRKTHQRLYVKLQPKIDELFTDMNRAIHDNEQSYSFKRTNHYTKDNNTNDDDHHQKIKNLTSTIGGIKTANELPADPDCIKENKARRQQIIKEAGKTRRPSAWVYDLLTRMKNELGIKSISMRGDASGKALKELRKDIEEQEGFLKPDKLKERIWGAYLKLKGGWNEEKYGQCTFVTLRKYWGENDPENKQKKKDLSWML